MDIQYGRLSIRKDVLEGIPFEEVEKRYPTIKKTLLKGAWKLANPKGVKAKEEKITKKGV
jgi:uncharacterized protein (DUF433 family)